jgi:hypothetical protein
MRDFLCPNCGQHLAFENSVCLSCGSALGFSLDDMALLVITSGEDSEHGGTVDSSAYRLCANLHVAECNWLVKEKPGMGAVAELCTSCKLTRARPNDADTAALAAFAGAEKAKRRLIVELTDLKLPIVSRDDDPQFGLVLPTVVLEKLRFIHTMIDEMAFQHVAVAGDARATMEAIADGLEVSSGGESPSHANISRSSAPVMHAAG